jgi:hypothetical protein
MVHLAEVPIRWRGQIVTVCFDELDGRIEATEYRVTAPGGEPVSLIRPPLGRLAEAALAEMRSHVAPQIAARSRSESAVAAANALLGTPGPRRGRPPLYGDSHWAAVARAYEGATAAPVQAVAQQFSVSGSLARKWVERARAKGLL